MTMIAPLQLIFDGHEPPTRVLGENVEAVRADGKLPLLHSEQPNTELNCNGAGILIVGTDTGRSDHLGRLVRHKTARG